MKSELPPINTSLIEDALGHIRINPKEWDQNKWDCGTTACLAGHMVRLGEQQGLVGDASWTTDCFGEQFKRVGWESVQEAATRIGGLTNAEANRLFWDTQTCTDIDELTGVYKDIVAARQAHEDEIAKL